MRGAVVLLRQLLLPPCHFAAQTNDYVVFIGLPVNRDGAECSYVRSPWPDLLMIPARGPDSASADEPGIDVRTARVARRLAGLLFPNLGPRGGAVSWQFAAAVYPTIWNASAARNTVPSSQWRPTSIMPTGSPADMPAGTEAAGWPVTSNGQVLEIISSARAT
jgi:hypothetical protein